MLKVADGVNIALPFHGAALHSDGGLCNGEIGGDTLAGIRVIDGVKTISTVDGVIAVATLEMDIWLTLAVS